MSDTVLSLYWEHWWDRHICREAHNGTHLKIFEEDAVAGPVDLCEEALVDDLTHQLEEVDLALIVGLVLEETEQLCLPVLVVGRRQLEFANEGRNLAVGLTTGGQLYGH